MKMKGKSEILKYAAEHRLQPALYVQHLPNSSWLWYFFFKSNSFQAIMIYFFQNLLSDLFILTWKVPLQRSAIMNRFVGIDWYIATLITYENKCWIIRYGGPIFSMCLKFLFPFKDTVVSSHVRFWNFLPCIRLEF